MRGGRRARTVVGDSPPMEPVPRGISPQQVGPDSDDDRLRFILAGQEHCDHFLTPLAAPAGRRVLVVGAGAGTEMLWCLRHGAREVVGIDVLEQSPRALAG